MKNINDIINHFKLNTNYEKLLYEATNVRENKSIKKLFEKISKDNSIDKKQKDNIYSSVLEYTKKISADLEKEVENIHKKGLEDGIMMSFLIDNNISLDKKDKTLNLMLDDFILNRLQAQIKLENKLDYKKNKDKIQKITLNANKENSKIIEKLKDLYEFQCDLESIEAYKIGFIDAIKFLLDLT